MRIILIMSLANKLHDRLITRRSRRKCQKRKQRKMSTRRNSTSSKVCCFCNLADDNEFEYGKFYEHDGIVTHYYCLLLSSNMEQKGEDEEGILGFLVEDIQREIRRGKRLICSYCKKVGATLGCCNIKCKRIFHYPCGLKAGSLHQFFGQFKSYCINHRPKQNIDSHILEEINSTNNLLCYICYDKVDPNDHVGTLWAPCCKKDAWFHRKCVQQLAMSSGYFFKCPLCNNKNEFQEVMKENGIFIPSQDASWELVPNAFEELLYRHNQCDATSCQCPKGRKHISSNAKWELVLCRTCGSQGIHMACGQLRWANPIWDCAECTAILCNTKNNGNIRSNNSNNSSQEFNSELDSDSDTDISVGTEFPMQCPLSNFSSSSSSTSLLDIAPEVKLRPGPRSFKLQQQIKAQQINKKSLELTYLKRNQTFDIKDSLLLNNDAIKSLTSNKSISQKRKKNDKQNDSQEERKSSVSNDKTSIEKILDIITIESDDNNDNDNDLKIILLKKTISPHTSLQGSHESLDKTVKSDSSNFLETNNIHQHESYVSELEIANQDASDILKQSAISLEGLNSLFLKYSESESTDTDTITVDESSMNIKITNVVSLPAEAFENTLDMTHKDALKSSANELPKESMLKNYISSTLPLKRSTHEVSNVVEYNGKKIKGDNSNGNLKKENFMKCCVTFDTNMRQNSEESSIKSDEIHKDIEGSLKRVSTFANRIYNLPLNIDPKEDSSKQLASSIKNTISNSSLNDVKEMQKNNIFHRRNKRYKNQVKSCYSKEGSASYNVLSKENPVKKMMKTCLHITGNSKLPLVPDPISDLTSINNQDIRNNATPSSSVTLPQTINNTTMINNNQKTIFTDQRLLLLKTMCPTNDGNNIQTEVSNNHKIATLSKEKLIPKISSSSCESPNKVFCDGDAGTSRAQTKSTGRRKRRLPSEYSESMHANDAIDSQGPATIRNVFLQVTNNHNTCHQPRLIPQYMNLDDLKFHTCGSDNIQMILYDTFSVNISMKNSKESKKRSATLTSSKEYITRARCEASSSKDYIAEQHIDKYFSKNENRLVNDKRVICSNDDVKENLDPVKSKTRNDTFNNSTLINNADNTVTLNDYVCENDNEKRFISNDTNLRTFNPRIYNTNTDVTDDVQSICNQISRTNFENVQQISLSNVISESKKETTNDDQSFCKKTDKIECSVNLDDLNIVTNKSVKKVLEDDIIFFTNKHVDDDREIRYDCIDDHSGLLNDKRFNDINVIIPKAQNRGAIAKNITKVTRDKYNILNKQIDKCNGNFIQCTAFHKNIENYNSKSNIKSNVKSCLKISIDLCKIQNLIDTKPELFIK